MTKPSIKSICVFCGSQPGLREAYRQQAAESGRLLAEKGIRLVFGGGRAGLMGVIADACLAAGGEAVGVMPQSLMDKEWGHTGLTRLEIVQTMHERKARMNELADAFVALPGGYGTLDEFFEAVTWAQLGFHSKPIGLLNTEGYFDGLLEFIGKAIDETFIHRSHIVLFVERDEPALLLEDLLQYRPQPLERWIRRKEEL